MDEARARPRPRFALVVLLGAAGLAAGFVCHPVIGLLTGGSTSPPPGPIAILGLYAGLVIGVSVWASALLPVRLGLALGLSVLVFTAVSWLTHRGDERGPDVGRLLLGSLVERAPEALLLVFWHAVSLRAGASKLFIRLAAPLGFMLLGGLGEAVSLQALALRLVSPLGHSGSIVQGAGFIWISGGFFGLLQYVGLAAYLALASPGPSQPAQRPN